MPTVRSLLACWGIRGGSTCKEKTARAGDRPPGHDRCSFGSKRCTPVRAHEDLRRSRSIEEKPPLIVAVLLYNGLPTWTPRQVTEGWNKFEYTFIDVGRLPPNGGRPHPLTVAFSGARRPHP